MSRDSKRKLVIIESPAKAKSLKNYLGKGWDVIASYGHVRDLPLNRIGVNTETLEPTYTVLPPKRAAVAKLRKIAAPYKEIYLAGDPDREGEAICWHIYKLLQGQSKDVVFKRIRFNSITREAIKAASQATADIDMDLVDAQQARRVMDRLVGYKISPYLWRTVGKGLSAGRVQTVALRLIVERELAIESFVPHEFWPVTASFNQEESTFNAKLFKFAGKRADGDKYSPGNKLEADGILENVRKSQWEISSVTEKNKNRKPVPPFITSSLQVAASSRLSMPPSVTMRLAQDLYEGFEIDGETTGLITYMRTDSVRIEPAAIEECRQYITDKWGKKALSPKPRRYRSSGGAQDAHEAIRPTDIKRTPELMAGILDPRHLRLYSIIWGRFAATQMADAIVAETVVLVSGTDAVFKTSGQKIVDPGFSVADPAQLKVTSEIPSLTEGPVSLEEVSTEQKFTKPLPRYSEAALVSEMKKKAIGRPSTYVSIIATLKKRTYVELVEKKLHPTQVGMVTTDLLIKLFPHLFDVGFTAELEELLDLVASGKKTYKEAVSQLYTPLAASLEEAMRRLPEIKASMIKETTEKCPECGKMLLEKMGKFGKFLACSGFPACRYTRPLGEPEKAVESGVDCLKCGKNMLLRNGRYGRYLACPDTSCGNTQPVPVGVKCPVEKCTGDLVERKSKKGKLFYSCSRYPDCEFAMWSKPLAKECPRCGFPLLEERKKGVYCPSCKKKID